jgi:hypothetical protein
MKFWISGEFSDHCTFKGAYREIEDSGVHSWFVDINSLDELVQRCKANGGMSVHIWADGMLIISDIDIEPD